MAGIYFERAYDSPALFIDGSCVWAPMFLGGGVEKACVVGGKSTLLIYRYCRFLVILC